MLCNSVVSGGFALLLLYLLALSVGSHHAMLACVGCGFASWVVNIGQDIDSRATVAAGMMAAVTSGAIAVLIVAGKVMLP
jgi:hypothetical protein